MAGPETNRSPKIVDDTFSPASFSASLRDFVSMVEFNCGGVARLRRSLESAALEGLESFTRCVEEHTQTGYHHKMSFALRFSGNILVREAHLRSPKIQEMISVQLAHSSVWVRTEAAAALCKIAKSAGCLPFNVECNLVNSMCYDCNSSGGNWSIKALCSLKSTQLPEAAIRILQSRAEEISKSDTLINDWIKELLAESIFARHKPIP